MAKIRRIRVKSVKASTEKLGQSPSEVLQSIVPQRPSVKAYAYDKDNFHSSELSLVTEIDSFLKTYSEQYIWIEIEGLGDSELLSFIQQKFNIHRLVIEDIVHTSQRPKLDEYEHYLFATSRLLYLNDEYEVENRQTSFLLLDRILISFQEEPTSCMEDVRIRLEAGKGSIRSGGSSFLMYAMMDVTLDIYFALLNKLGEELDTLEDLLYRRADKTIMYQTQEIKRATILVRRAAWPERDKLNDLIRSESPLISKETQTFLRDAYDHTMQILDLVEHYKELSSSLIDMNLSFNSNRMNEIVKVLTIISSIFIPLTFIAGVYGMNFAYQDPETGKILHHNMPELYSPHGYLYTLAVMLLIAIVQLVYFWRKGWFQ